MDTRRLWMMWWSGVFGLAMFVHLMRALANLPVVIGSAEIGVWVSWLVFPLAGLAAGWLMRRALEAKSSAPPRAPWEQLGGCHPMTLPPEDVLQAPRCRLQMAYHMVDEDHEDEEWPNRGL